jgi:hypothetical protein
MLKRIVVGAAIAAAGWGAYRSARRWWGTWGVDPQASTRVLPGDELVSDPTAVDTRAIEIDAPPDAVWPWLVQMGFGRAGWYSYDQLDMKGKSSDAIVEAWQHLEVGDIVPTHPDGGFEVRIVEPERTLVLYTDTALVESQAAAARNEEQMPPGLAMSGAMLKQTPRSFAASWTFALEPVGPGRTRFIERFRARFDEPDKGFTLVAPFMGFGVFVMMQRQMLGIRERAERDVLARPTVTPYDAERKPEGTNGHASGAVEETVTTAIPG